jgi:outer membrane receptor protein involved in Fe transport
MLRALFLLAAAAPAFAAEPPAPAPAPAASAPEAAQDRRILEDDNVRIEETRIRGQLSRVTVKSKIGNVREYEIIVGPGGRDPSQQNARGASGQRAWSVLSF